MGRADLRPLSLSLPGGTFPETVYGTPSSPASHVPHCSWDPTPESGCSSRSGSGVACPLLSPLRLQHPVPNSIPNKDSTVACTAAPNSRYFCAPEVQSLGGEIPCLSDVFGLELFMKERKGRGVKWVEESIKRSLLIYIPYGAYGKSLPYSTLENTYFVSEHDRDNYLQ